MRTLLVDGDNLVMRAIHAAPKGGMSAEDGVETGPLVIFLNMLSHTVRDWRVDRMLVGFDSRDTTLARRRVYPQYKAKRATARLGPGGKEEHFAQVWRLLDALGVPRRAWPGWEADDVVASACRYERDTYPDREVMVLSGDKDLLQLVDDKTLVIRPGMSGVWGPGRVMEKFGVPASALGMYLALAGDVSDGVPGVRGIGPRKARALVTEAVEQGRSMDDLIRSQEGKWDDGQAKNAWLSYVLVDLLSRPMIEVGQVQAQEFDLHRRLDGDLATILDRYGMSRLAERVAEGRLWSSPGGEQLALPDGVDLG